MASQATFERLLVMALGDPGRWQPGAGFERRAVELLGEIVAHGGTVAAVRALRQLPADAPVKIPHHRGVTLARDAGRWFAGLTRARNREALAAAEPLRRWLAAEPDLVLRVTVNLALLDWAVTPRQKLPELLIDWPAASLATTIVERLLRPLAQRAAMRPCERDGRALGRYLLAVAAPEVTESGLAQARALPCGPADFDRYREALRWLAQRELVAPVLRNGTPTESWEVSSAMLATVLPALARDPRG